MANTARFPDWAPPALVALHKKLVERAASSRGTERNKLVERLRAGVPLVNSHATNIQAVGSPQFFLPADEELSLLETVLTDEQMRPVWKAIGKRVSSKSAYHQFFSDIESSKAGWRGELKLTASQRRKHFAHINHLAMKLSEAVLASPEFFFVRPHDLVTAEDTKRYLTDILGIDLQANYPDAYIKTEDDFVDYARFYLIELFPDTHEVLSHISAKATEFLNRRPIAAKPGSKNANIHFFIRMFSRCLRYRFGQPLHEVVAITASTVFKVEPIGVDLVRKLVKS